MLIFEMVNGYPPFYDDDKINMYKNITEIKYYMPRRMSKARGGGAAANARCCSVAC